MDLQPVLTIQPSDTVMFRTLNAGWSVYDHNDPFTAPPKAPRALKRDQGHAICGPVALQGVQPEMALVVHLDAIHTTRRGFSVGSVRLALADTGFARVGYDSQRHQWWLIEFWPGDESNGDTTA